MKVNMRLGSNSAILTFRDWKTIIARIWPKMVHALGRQESYSLVGGERNRRRRSSKPVFTSSTRGVS